MVCYDWLNDIIWHVLLRCYAWTDWPTLFAFDFQLARSDLHTDIIWHRFTSGYAVTVWLTFFVIGFQLSRIWFWIMLWLVLEQLTYGRMDWHYLTSVSQLLGANERTNITWHGFPSGYAMADGLIVLDMDFPDGMLWLTYIYYLTCIYHMFGTDCGTDIIWHRLHMV